MAMKSTSCKLLSAVLLMLRHRTTLAFAPRPTFARTSRSTNKAGSLSFSSVAEDTATSSMSQSQDAREITSTVRAPLKYIGPYPSLALRFPDLATANQLERNDTGVGLDFILDTAANTNTINQQVAKELRLEVVGSALPGLGAGGVIAGGDTFMIGDCRLEGLPKEDEFTFMTGLTAAALPVASPASAGLLSLAFFNCFEGGVEFRWNPEMKDGVVSTPPSVTFHGEKSTVGDAVQGMTRVPITPLPVTLLPSVMIEINGVSMPALLDTGSPITVMNAQAAQAAKVETVRTQQHSSSNNNNPFSAIANKFKEAQQSAQAAARGDVLAIADAQGKRVELRKTIDKVHVALSGDEDKVEFGDGNIYVGELPGLAAMNGIGVESPPAVVLGMDVLRTRHTMFLRSKDNEVYF